MREPSFIPHRLLTDHTFLILDPAQASQSFWKDVPSTPLVPERLVNEADSMPRLVEICDLTAPQQATILKYLLGAKPEQGRAVAALLTTKTSAASLQQHLIRRLIIQPPKQGQLLFRYYDPRVFRHLLWMATPLQLATIFGPITRWTWCDAQGIWRHNTPPDGISAAQYLRVGALRLDRIGLLERTLKFLRKKQPNVEDDADNKLAKKVGQLLDTASHYLEEEKDLQLFVQQAYSYHFRIHQHPELQSRLKAVDKNTTYVVLCHDLTEQAYQQCIRDMTPTRKEHA